MTAPNAGSTDDAYALALRDGLPVELRSLIKRFPRDGWPTPAELGPWSVFWLERHDEFRALSDAIEDGCQQMLDRNVDADRFRQWALARLNAYIGHLDLHHRVEEIHIFPAFAAVEPSLQRGYALLEADHAIIHPRLEALHAAGTILFETEPADADAIEQVTRTLFDDASVLGPELTRHLIDEEDLLLPVVMAHGEGALNLH